jgi:predicted acetyltransferase
MIVTSIFLVPAERHEKFIIRNLMQLYQYELASFTGKTIDPLGLFDYSYLDHYWTADGKHEGRVPFLIRVDDQLAGFILINQYSYIDPHMETYNVAEFFVMNVFRRKGIGEVAARRLFALFPGQWEIAVLRENTPAIAFWRSVVASVSNGTFEEIERSDVGWDGPVLRFSSACDSCMPFLDR